VSRRDESKFARDYRVALAKARAQEAADLEAARKRRAAPLGLSASEQDEALLSTLSALRLPSYHPVARISLLRELTSRVLSRSEFDAAATRLAQAGRIDLLPIDHPTDITRADEAAAMRVGTERRMLVWVR
jgi:hypothetical protein